MDALQHRPFWATALLIVAALTDLAALLHASALAVRARGIERPGALAGPRRSFAAGFGPLAARLATSQR